MPHSHHSHSGEYCAHARSQLADVVDRAAALGFRTFGLSEHVPRALPTELYPEERAAGLDAAQLEARFRAYLAHARRLQRVHDERGDMHVLVGCETENTDGGGAHLDYFVHSVLGIDPALSPRPAPAQIGAGTLDYLVGSVHHVHSTPIDFDRPTFDAALAALPGQSDTDRHAALMLAYLDAQLLLLQRLQPEVIGHFDLCRLYLPTAPIRPDPASPSSSGNSLLHRVAAAVERNIRYAVSYGALFELNASSFRKGWSTSYPAPDVLELILALGGRLCLSDDSHGTHQVGLNYHRLRDYLLALPRLCPSTLTSPPSVWHLRRSQDTEPFLPDEGARLERERSSRPGHGAPLRFPRGTHAVELSASDWAAWPGWDRISAEAAAAE